MKIEQRQIDYLNLQKERIVYTLSEYYSSKGKKAMYAKLFNLATNPAIRWQVIENDNVILETTDINEGIKQYNEIVF